MEESPDFATAMATAANLRRSNPLVSLSPGENHILLLLIPEDQQTIWMSPELILTKWAEYHLRKLDDDVRVNNFTTDWSVCIRFFRSTSLFFNTSA